VAALATLPDVTSRWRALTDDEVTVALARIDDGTALVRWAAPLIDDRVAADADLARLVAARIAEGVISVLQNPEGLRSETVGEYSFTRDGSVSDGRIRVDVTSLAPSQLTAGRGYSVSLWG
jgi:hypothetical protein